MTSPALLAHSGVAGWVVLLVAPLLAVAVWEWLERRGGRMQRD